MDQMDLDIFQEWTETTAVYRESVEEFLDKPRDVQAEWLNLEAAIRGLVGESGEIMELAKKQFRNHLGEITPEFQGRLLDEVGDLAYYMARVCEEAGFDLSEVFTHNQRKLENRRRRGELKFHE